MTLQQAINNLRAIGYGVAKIGCKVYLVIYPNSKREILQGWQVVRLAEQIA